MLKTILVDDDESNLSSLGEKLARHCPEVNILAKCNDAEQGIAAIESLRPDLVFLDIEMPVMNGFLLLQQLSFKDFALVFVTAYDHYAIKAIRFSALDYLVKPVAIPDLVAAVGRALDGKNRRTASSRIDLLLEHFSRKQAMRIPIPMADGLQFINLSDIVYLEANDNYTNIWLVSKQKLLVSRTLKNFEDMLPADDFVRIHNATIINKVFVEKYIRGEGGQVVMKNGTTLDVSKRKKALFLAAIGS